MKLYFPLVFDIVPLKTGDMEENGIMQRAIKDFLTIPENNSFSEHIVLHKIVEVVYSSGFVCLFRLYLKIWPDFDWILDNFYNSISSHYIQYFKVTFIALNLYNRQTLLVIGSDKNTPVKELLP